jgi:hypothetical protein
MPFPAVVPASVPVDRIREVREGVVPMFAWPSPPPGEAGPVPCPPADTAALKAARDSARLNCVPALWDVLAEHLGGGTALVDPAHDAKSKSPLYLSFEQVMPRPVWHPLCQSRCER